MKKFILWILIFTFFIWMSSFVFSKDKYIGFYYPDRYNLFEDIQSDGYFETMEQCRVWVNTQISIHNKGNLNYDYECGKNCDMSGGKPYVCEETIK